MILIFFIIFLISFFLALLSMRDFSLPREVFYLINRLKIKGKIVFLKNKIVHYSSSSELSSSEEGKET